MAWKPLSKLRLPKALKCLLSGWIQPSEYLEKHMLQRHKANPSLGKDRPAKLWPSQHHKTWVCFLPPPLLPVNVTKSEGLLFCVTAAGGAVLEKGPAKAQEVPWTSCFAAELSSGQIMQAI